MTDRPHLEQEFTARFNGRVVLRILGLLRPYRMWTLGFLILVAATAWFDSMFAYLSKQIVDQGILVGDRARLMSLLARYGLLSVVQALGVLGFIYLAGVLGERVHYDLRKALFDHLQELSLSYFDRTPVGWIMARVASDTERMSQLVTWGLLDATWSVLNVIVTVSFMLTINRPLAMMVALIVPVMIAVSVWFQKRILSQYRQVRKLNSQITGAFTETIAGVRVVKALVREKQNLHEFSAQTGELYRAACRAAQLSALFQPTVQIVGAVGVGMIVWYGGLQIHVGKMSVGGVQAFLSYIAFMIWPIRDLARVFAVMQQSIASAERVFSLLDTRPEIVDREGADDPGSIRGDIEFEHVHFAYRDGKEVLSDFNLHIRQGERIALVGPTGGGKSTIVNLLCRFYEPTKGAIRIAGRDYTTLTQLAIRSRIGMVLQTPHLFSGTIRENIRYGRLDATDEEVEMAARIANAHEFIIGMERGYDEEVGEGGVLLSVGQKQLISLARAVLADPDILIMDEATSSVDTLTEARVQQGMKAVMRGRTSLIIAHRLSTIKNADRILVIEKGRIVEMGTHKELIRARGRYYALYTRRFQQQWKRNMLGTTGSESPTPIEVAKCISHSPCA